MNNNLKRLVVVFACIILLSACSGGTSSLTPSPNPLEPIAGILPSETIPPAVTPTTAAPSQTYPEPTSTRRPTKTAMIVPTQPPEEVFDGAMVTYVGNSGFLVTVGDKRVLIDAFIDSDPSAVKQQLTNAQHPFDHVDLILVTHDHSDHFSPSMVADYMTVNPDAIFVSTSQAAERLEPLVDNFSSRVISLDPRTGDPKSTEVNGIQVKAIYMSHGVSPDEQEIYNNAYVVTLNRITFFHTGDIARLADILPYHLEQQNIDFAFIVNFYMQNRKDSDVIESGIAANYLFPIHYSFTTPAFNAEKILAGYPGSVIFEKELDYWVMPVP